MLLQHFRLKIHPPAKPVYKAYQLQSPLLLGVRRPRQKLFLQLLQMLQLPHQESSPVHFPGFLEEIQRIARTRRLRMELGGIQEPLCLQS